MLDGVTLGCCTISALLGDTVVGAMLDYHIINENFEKYF